MLIIILSFLATAVIATLAYAQTRSFVARRLRYVDAVQHTFAPVLCGIAAGLTHMLLNAHSPLPTIGASGAIAGVMGAYLVKFPGARIVTLIFIVFFVTTVELPAAFVLLYWFVLQIFSGVGSITRPNATRCGFNSAFSGSAISTPSAFHFPFSIFTVNPTGSSFFSASAFAASSFFSRSCSRR